MVGWIVAGLVAALGLGFVASRGRKYGRLFSNEHLIEIARAAPAIKAAALARVDDADAVMSPSDPRVVVTQVGLAIMYSMNRREGTIVHHFSVSIPGDFTPHGVGITFVVWIAMLMRLPIDRVTFEAGRSFVHHGEVRLSTDEHDEMVRAEVLCVTQTNVTELFRSCLDARPRPAPLG